MSLVAPVSRAGAERRATAPATLAAAARSDAAVLGVVGVAALALCALTWGRWGDLGVDTGYDLLAASRVAHGELPFADFAYWYGPVAPLLLGGVSAIAGVGLTSALLAGIALSLAIVGLTYALARRFGPPLAAGSAALLTAAAAFGTANTSYVLAHAFSAPLAMALALVVLLALTARTSRPVAAGIAAGLVALTRPEVAVAVYAAVAAWVLLGLRPADTRAARAREALRFTLPAIGLPLIGYGLFLTAVPLRELLWDNLYPRAFVEQGGNEVLRVHAPLTPGSFAKLAASGIVYGAALAALVVAGRALGQGGWRRRAVLAGAAAAGLLALALVLVRPDAYRHALKFAYAWVPLGAAVAVVLTARPLLKGRAGREDRNAALLALLLAALAANVYAEFAPYPKTQFANATVYLMPVVAVFLVWLHTSLVARGRPGVAAIGTAWIAGLAITSCLLVVHDARLETVRVSGPHGEITATAADGPAFQGALDVIARETQPGDPVLLAPQMTALYVLSGRVDPLPQLSLLPGSLATARDERAAIRRLGRVRLAIVDRAPLTIYGHGPFGSDYDRLLAAWLRDHFDRAKVLRGTGPGARILDVWIRRSS